MSRGNDEADITRLLERAAEVQGSAGDELLRLVYTQLRAIAQQQMAGERRDHTLQATALVHEAYLRLVGDRDVPWAGRAHFFTAAAEAMRRILIEHARKRRAAKRGGDQRGRVDWNQVGDVVDLATSEHSEEILALDEAILRLESDDPEAAAVVRLRFYAGLSVEDTVAARGVSPRTIKRAWSYARARLLSDLRRSAS